MSSTYLRTENNSYKQLSKGEQVVVSKINRFIKAKINKANELNAAIKKIEIMKSDLNSLIKSIERKANFERGRFYEEEIRKDTDNPKNKEAVGNVRRKGERAIPDIYAKGAFIAEIKNTKAVYNTKQIRILMQAAVDAKVPFILITGRNTHISRTLLRKAGKHQDQFLIIRRNNLDP